MPARITAFAFQGGSETNRPRASDEGLELDRSRGLERTSRRIGLGASALHAITDTRISGLQPAPQPCHPLFG